MELELTAEQDELRGLVRSVLERECPLTVARSVVEDGASTDHVWRELVHLGAPALAVREEAGGLGLGFVEVALVAEELGRVLAPGPWLSTVTQYAAAIAECAPHRPELLAPVASGDRTGSVAVAGPTGTFDPLRTSVVATPVSDGFELSGVAHHVLGAPDVDELLVVARLPGTEGVDGVCAFRVATGDVRTRARRPVDGTRPVADVDLDGLVVGPDALTGEAGEVADALVRATQQATVAIALEAVGTCQTIFDLTLEYAKGRHQFGVPIGSFQAVKHKFADMAVALERARATGYFAALTIAEDDERRATATSVAKVAAGDCQRLLSKEGIQIHGGMGFTWEHDMHLLVKRVKATAPWFGDAAVHREQIAAALLA